MKHLHLGTEKSMFVLHWDSWQNFKVVDKRVEIY